MVNEFGVGYETDDHSPQFPWQHVLVSPDKTRRGVPVSAPVASVVGMIPTLAIISKLVIRYPCHVHYRFIFLQISIKAFFPPSLSDVKALNNVESAAAEGTLEFLQELETSPA